MGKDFTSKGLGDAKSPALQPSASALRLGPDQAKYILANQAPCVQKPSSIGHCIAALKSSNAQRGSVTTCKQFLWLSFFFDGTGNNREFDLELFKHSNVARLYRAHKPTSQIDGILSVYIPGVGTYFPEVGDNGGSALGLGCGSMGEERLNFALKQLDEFLKAPIAKARVPANAIQEINVAIFGFSRGAALARAFLNMIMEERCEKRGQKWYLKNSSWLVRFRFLGLFDTVASVGLPMSANITGLYESYNHDIAGNIDNRLRNYRLSRPERLAFAADGRPGADPAPGPADGHKDWGGRLRVDETVEEVRHFVAAHEVRNSFPVDSVSTLANGRVSTPTHFYESVFPGAHSDVGGGYAPGEGAKSLVSVDSLSLMPLRLMYEHSIRSGVPMLAEWTADNQADFRFNEKLREIYNYYIKKVGAASTLGDGINRHMALYYGWRFRSIRKKAEGDKTEAAIVASQDAKFSEKDLAFDREVRTLELKESIAKISLDGLTVARDMQANTTGSGDARDAITANNVNVERARQKYELARSDRLLTKARKDSLPNMRKFHAMLTLYDQQLLSDVRAIRIAINNGASDGLVKKNRRNLRPHYKSLLDAYENEFEKNSGLKDEKIIAFFDNYVHDSLAGFAKDATLPSDPRVVYLGGDEKYEYASLEGDSQFSADQEKRMT
ncbi:T6SS phospholipase effector Tle1-like catalytic domain-containing protein [Massilia yuzhufengensis]|uniref:Uncharacterized alpha/beta hydrolase domain n=1 Tax=Massilia yuzhufengensis TaxID=1164594 RepID=A0A1I1I0J8_9BURK|nr:DUF2235 domain-containing protein [Massilia yuzhufengensis]SFC29676.1 Uncharacterized alpha/beta hydrolase domain [Massilia yuzhufengensis]